MANTKSSNARRREVRRTLQKPTAAWRELLRTREMAWATGFALIFAVVGTLITWPTLDRELPLEAGQMVTRPIVSRVAFSITDLDATELDRRERANQIPPQFEANRQLRFEIESALKALPEVTRDAATVADLDPQTREDLGLTPDAFTDLARYVDPETGTANAQWQSDMHKLVRDLFSTAIITPDDMQTAEQLSGRPVRIVITHPDSEVRGQAQRLKQDWAVLNIEDPDRLRAEFTELVLRYEVSLRPVLVDFIMHRIGPTYHFSESATAAAKREATDQVEVHRVDFDANQVIVAAGEVLTTEQLALLQAEHKNYLASRSPAQRWLPRAGLFGLVLMIAVGMWAYFFVYAPRIVRNPMRGMAITGLLLLCLSASVTTATVKPEFIVFALTFPALFASMVLAIAYDQRFALAMGVVLAVLVGIALQVPLAETLVILAGMGVAVMQLREIRSRSKLVIVGVYAGLAMAMASTIVGLAGRPVHLEGVSWLVFMDAGLAFFSGFLAGLLVQGILPVVERAFNVTTAMTLKELNDASHPLLQKLAHEAPGTYQHSLRIADMAEAAAEAIDADGLLCRVGAMYHDIGKTHKPMYFIENQGGGPNKHAKLPPAMSLLIIVGHVKDGVEMAREFGLPPVIRHFVESHHGTTLVEYFFAQAKKNTLAEDKPSPSEFEYRYPGPKPRTREAAILMLCDAVEGAARAMDEPNANRLETLVKTMANKRLMDGQFDDCDLTLQDLSRIEQAVTKSLCAMYHSRIKYPDDEKTQVIDMDAVHKGRSTAG